MVKNSQTSRRQIADGLFECVWPFCGVGTLRIKSAGMVSISKVEFTLIPNLPLFQNLNLLFLYFSYLVVKKYLYQHFLYLLVSTSIDCQIIFTQKFYTYSTDVSSALFKSICIRIQKECFFIVQNFWLLLTLGEL